MKEREDFTVRHLTSGFTWAMMPAETYWRFLESFLGRYAVTFVYLVWFPLFLVDQADVGLPKLVLGVADALQAVCLFYSSYEMYHSYFGQFLVDTANAQICCEKDRQMIADRLQTKGGFVGLDKRIQEQRREEKRMHHIAFIVAAAHVSILGGWFLCAAVGTVHSFNGILDNDKIRLWAMTITLILGFVFLNYALVGTLGCLVATCGKWWRISDNFQMIFNQAQLYLPVGRALVERHHDDDGLTLNYSVCDSRC